jgi:predicted transcriptional regulator
MTNLVLETCDRFITLYDLVALVGEGCSNESMLASSSHLSHAIVHRMLSFMIEEGYVKTARSDSEFKITVLGTNFLREYEGMRKFLS